MEAAQQRQTADIRSCSLRKVKNVRDFRLQPHQDSRNAGNIKSNLDIWMQNKSPTDNENITLYFRDRF
jgi:hypothetical protein